MLNLPAKEGKMIPQDGAMLFSFLNMKLRDEYDSLSALCEDLGLNEEEIEQKMEEMGYRYDGRQNRFL